MFGVFQWMGKCCWLGRVQELSFAAGHRVLQSFTFPISRDVLCACRRIVARPCCCTAGLQSAQASALIIQPCTQQHHHPVSVWVAGSECWWQQPRQRRGKALAGSIIAKADVSEPIPSLDCSSCHLPHERFVLECGSFHREVILANEISVQERER